MEQETLNALMLILALLFALIVASIVTYKQNAKKWNKATLPIKDAELWDEFLIYVEKRLKDLPEATFIVESGDEENLIKRENSFDTSYQKEMQIHRIKNGDMPSYNYMDIVCKFADDFWFDRNK